MSTLASSFAANRATFYDYDTGALHRVWPRYSGIAISGVFVAFAFNLGTDFLNSVIAAVAILAGFSFSVLFYLSEGRMRSSSDSTTLETEVRRDKLRKLRDEIFDNMSYFNVIAVACAGMSLIILLEPDATLVPASLPWALQAAIGVVIFSFKALFLALTLEVILTFYRNVGRVIYLFRQARSEEP